MMNYNLNVATDKEYINNLQDRTTSSLVMLAKPILNEMINIKHYDTTIPASELKNKFISKINQFEKDAQKQGIANDVILGARYCLCSVIDEAVMVTDWGKQSQWSNNSLLVIYHNETWGGEKFFKLLDNLMKNPDKHIELLELLYYCLILGFKGQYRISENGEFIIDSLSGQILDILSRIKGGFQPVLSENWEDNCVQSEIKKYPIPLWASVALFFMLSLMCFIWLRTRLATRSDEVFTNIIKIAPPIFDYETKKIQPPKPAPVSTVRLSDIFIPEIKENLITVRDEQDRSVIVLKGDGVFESGSEIIKNEYVPIISRVADALSEIDGRVLVTGHTDNVPIKSVRFASNWELSQARADAVKDLLGSRLNNKVRFRAEGKADSEPLVPNTSRENKARNRRVEITLFVSPVQTKETIDSNSKQDIVK